MTKPWMIDELAYAGPEHLDPSFVAAYERKAGYVLADGTTAPGGVEGTGLDVDIHALRDHGLVRSSTLVDLGTGTGRLALAAATEFGQVIAADVSPAMLALLRNRAAEAGVSNLTTVQAGFLSYEHAGPPADGVYTRNALHQLPDFWKTVALERIAGLLRPGGVLRLRDLVYDFQPHEAAEVFERWMAGAADDPAKGYTRADYEEHIRTEYSTYRGRLEPMLATAGFEIVTAEFGGRIYAAYTCVKS
jgi:ubiquinone/menaquinone biosynthesis C-methylase UbiE